MHHYSFHIGDYATHTRHLTILEDIAYRRCLDLYYLHERPLPTDLAATARAIGMREHMAEVEQVVREFFSLDEERGGWVNERADAEIRKCNAATEQASEAGKASARKRQERVSKSATDRSTKKQRPQVARSTPVEQPSNERSTPVQRPLNDRSTDAERPCNHPVPSTQYPIPPNPPGGGASASHRPEPEPEPPPGPDREVEELTDALTATRYRAGIASHVARRSAVRKSALRLLTTGLSPGRVRELSDLATERSEGDPGALLAHWLDGDAPAWRSVLDEQTEKRKAAGIRKRAPKPTDDVLAGIYGEQSDPKPAASVIDDVLGKARRAQ